MVQAEILEHGVSFGRCSIHKDLLFVLDLILDEIANLAFYSLNPLGELTIRRCPVQSQLRFTFSQLRDSLRSLLPISLIAERTRVCPAITNEGANATPINVVQLCIDNRESRPLEQIFQRL